jgi:crotonobetainyl-CoA:carnitine CoA-transferase CaiB-like acyl-CoA transferase
MLIPVLAGLILEMPRGDLLSALEAAGVPAGPINTVAEVFADPQVVARGMRVDLADAAAAGGAIPGVRTPIVFDGEAAVAASPSPALGAHDADVLADPAWGGPAGAGTARDA